jgi:hypothetical protein
MPYNLHIIRSEDFFRLDTHGHFDLESSRRVLAALAAACREQEIEQALLDVRNSEGTLSTTDLYALAAAFGEIGIPPTFRLAVLHRFVGGEKAEFFAMCANNRGWNVRAHDNFEDAFEWLSTEEKI